MTYLPFGTTESTSTYEMAILKIVIFGESQPLPDEGIISTNTTLKNIFQKWNKNFNSTCILDYCNNNDNSMRMYVNNKENFDYENYIVKDGDIIIIDYR
jgi:hypothetical protein